jgi:predicted nucleic acid-binding protein
VVTHPKIYSPPTPFLEAWEFLRILCSSPFVEICPWTQTARARWGHLCQSLNLNGNDCTDAMLAATALDRGLRLVTFDKGFQRFPGLQWLLLQE